MAQIIFGGMDNREIVGVFPKAARRKFPDVRVVKVDSIDTLADALRPNEGNVVFHKFDNEEVLATLGLVGITATPHSGPIAVVHYDAASGKEYVRAVYAAIESFR